MQYVALIQSDACTINAQCRVIPKASVVVVEQLADLVNQLTELINGRKKAIDDACEKGYQQSSARAKEQHEENNVKQLLVLEEQYRKHCEQQTQEVVSIALAVVEKLIETEGRQEILLQTIEKAYKALAPKQLVKLIVHSSLVGSISARLNEYHHQITVEGNELYTLDSAILKTDATEISIGLDSQLAIIEDYLYRSS